MLEIIVVIIGSVASVIISFNLSGYPILSVIFGMMGGPAIAVAWIALLVERMTQKKMGLKGPLFAWNAITIEFSAPV